MKKLITVVLLALLAGCSEFGAGVGTGVAASRIMLDDAQKGVVEVAKELNAETTEGKVVIAKVKAAKAEGEKMIETMKEINLKDFIKPETLEAIESLKGREKDPVIWVALASIIGNALWGGTAIEKKRKKKGTEK